MKKIKEKELKYSIKDMPEDDRPQERLLKYGASYLTNAELLALVIRSGSRSKTSVELSQQILNMASKDNNKESNPLKALRNFTASELMQIPGIGEAKASMIIAALALSERINKTSLHSKKRIRTPGDMASFVMSDMKSLDREMFKVAVLNTKKEVDSIRTVSKGTVNATIVQPRDVFQIAIKENAHTIILLHNHPTGDLTPSREDINITNNLKEVGDLVKINVIDHIIIGDDRYYSFLENDLI